MVPIGCWSEKGGKYTIVTSFIDSLSTLYSYSFHLLNVYKSSLLMNLTRPSSNFTDPCLSYLYHIPTPPPKNLQKNLSFFPICTIRYFFSTLHVFLRPFFSFRVQHRGVGCPSHQIARSQDSIYGHQARSRPLPSWLRMERTTYRRDREKESGGTGENQNIVAGIYGASINRIYRFVRFRFFFFFFFIGQKWRCRVICEKWNSSVTYWPMVSTMQRKERREDKG